MALINTIEHQGIIVQISDSIIKVKVERTSACASCHSKGACSLTETEDRIIDITSNSKDFSIGEEVVVSLSPKSGLLSLMLGYILPLIVFLSSLATASLFLKSEIIIGIYSILAIITYYFILSLLNKKINKALNIQIKKLQ